MTSYHEKYRPTKFKHIIGHDLVVKSLQDVIDRKASNTFMFTGEAGTGKTTLARITADALGAGTGIIEVDAATNSGVDNMRDIQESARYSINGLPRALIIDECHRLSPQAWDTLLKVTEEPRAKLFWFFCTTLPTKVPKTIHTRATTYALRLFTNDELYDIVEDVVKAEKLDTPSATVEVCVENAGGSARQALTNLAQCADMAAGNAQKLLVGAAATKGVIDLARFLLDGKGSWTAAMTYVADLGDSSPEGTRIVISNYMGKVLRGARNDQEAMRLIGILDNWTTPFNTNEGITPLMVAIGRSLYKGT